MEVDSKACSSVFHVAHDNDGHWYINTEGENQRSVTVTDLTGMFAAALAKESHPVTRDAKESCIDDAKTRYGM